MRCSLKCRQLSRRTWDLSKEARSPLLVDDRLGRSLQCGRAARMMRSVRRPGARWRADDRRDFNFKASVWLQASQPSPGCAPPHAQASQRLIDQVCPVARSGNAQPSRPTARGRHRAGCQRSLPQTQAHLPGSRAEKASSSGDTHLSASQFLGKRLFRKTLDTFLMLLRLA